MVLCKNNCGFHGNDSFHGYCSKCSKIVDIEKQQVKVVDQSIDIVKSVIETKPKDRKRCESCRKKIGIYGFHCKCDGYFCTVHRYPESHQCSFDYRAEGREKIMKENPTIKAAKIEKL